MENILKILRENNIPKEGKVKVKLFENLWALSHDEDSPIAVCRVTEDKKLVLIGQLIGRDLL